MGTKGLLTAVSMGINMQCGPVRAAVSLDGNRAVDGHSNRDRVRHPAGLDTSHP